MDPRRQLLHDIRNDLARLSARADLMRLQGGDSVASHATHVANLTRSVADRLRALEHWLADDVLDAEDGPSRDSSPVGGGSTLAALSPLRPSGLSRTLPSPGAPAPGTERTRREESETAESSHRSRAVGLAPGDTIGTLRMIEMIGRGGMGTVMLARDVQLGRMVAVKLVDHASWHGARAREAFLREARAMARVHHPNVVTIHSFGEHRGAPFFVMEYVPGTTLDRLLEVRGGPLPLDQGISVIDQACRGLEAIHRAGALHCDVKPANILIGPSFHVAVADLGLSRNAGDGTGMNGGTPGFVAPELLSDRGARATERGDVYAMGATAYQMMTNRKPFAAKTLREMFDRQLRGDHAPPSTVADVPETLDDIIGRAMSVNPAARQPSAEALRRELLAACETVPRSYATTTVVVVDDDAELLAHTTSLVEQVLPGAAVLSFDDPRRALEAAEGRVPDIAIADLEMPGMNGLELTAALKSSPEGQRIQVVMLTGVGSARDWEALRHLGASGFLLKPVDEAELSSLLRCLAVADA